MSLKVRGDFLRLSSAVPRSGNPRHPRIHLPSSGDLSTACSIELPLSSDLVARFARHMCQARALCHKAPSIPSFRPPAHHLRTYLHVTSSTHVRHFTSAPRLLPTSDAPLRPRGTRVRQHSDHPAVPEPFDVDAVNCPDHSRPLSHFNGALDPGTAAAPRSVPPRQRTGSLGNCEC